VLVPPPCPAVRGQLLGLTDIEGEVAPAPHCQVSELLLVGRLIVTSDQAYPLRVSNLVLVVGEQGVQEGTKHTPLWFPPC
jgi:hypothetical protein